MKTFARDLYDECIQIIHSTTVRTKQQLLPFSEALISLQELYDRSASVLEVSELVKEVKRVCQSMLMKVSRETEKL